MKLKQIKPKNLTLYQDFKDEPTRQNNEIETN